MCVPLTFSVPQFAHLYSGDKKRCYKHKVKEGITAPGVEAGVQQGLKQSDPTSGTSPAGLGGVR